MSPLNLWALLTKTNLNEGHVAGACSVQVSDEWPLGFLSMVLVGPNSQLHLAHFYSVFLDERPVLIEDMP